MHLDDSVAFSYPHELSGGMRRRAAVATAMACDPDLLMMDEPFNGIDESTRERLCQQVLDLRLHAGQSILLVTHAIEEALLLGDAIVILGETPGAQRLEIDLSHPRDCLSREFETQLLRIRRLLAEQSA
jgi:NitT/TauT family transport system ATP-binding protein